MRRLRRKRRNRRRVWSGIGLAGLYLAIGFFALPPLVKSQLEKRLSATTGRTVTVAKVRTNPLTLALTLEQFAVSERESDGVFLGWDRLYVNVDALTSLVGSWKVREIDLSGFHAAITVNPDGSLNFSDLLEAFAPPEDAASPAKPARPVRVGRMRVTQARLDVADRSQVEPFQTTLGPVDFMLTAFHTGGKGDAPYRFAAVTEAGERLVWSGTLNAVPFRSTGELRLESIVLGKYAPYYAPRMQADLRDGNLTVSGRYEVNLDATARQLRLHEGVVELRDLEVVDRAGGRQALDAPLISVSGIEVDGVARQASIARVLVDGGKVVVRREVDGVVNLVRMAQPEREVAPVPADAGAMEARAGPALDVKVDEVAITDVEAEWIDLAAPWPAQLGVTGLNVSLRNLSLADDAVMPLAASFSWTPAGAVAINGEITLKPAPSADLQVDVTGLSLIPVGPYLEGVVKTRIAQGALSTKSRLRTVVGEGDPEITIEGDVQVDSFSLEDVVQGEELAGFARLELTGLRAGTAPLSVTLDEVKLAGPTARVAIAEDGSLNLASVFMADPTDEQAPGGSEVPQPDAPSSPEAEIIVGRIVIEDGEFSLADRSVSPQVNVALKSFGGTIAGLASDNLARGDVKLRAAVDGVGPVVITGRLDPLGAEPYVDLKLDFRNVDLLAFGPYSAKYAGYDLSRGKLLLDVAFRLEGERLHSNNVVTLDQFTFGAASNSPDATKLPVRMAVALLKDLDGKIIIDVPIEGRTSDPEFRIGRVVLRVITNLLTRAAVSPFALLGSMFGGGGDELAFQEFAPGTAVLVDSETAKLETVIKALVNRPALNLAIEGAYDATVDTDALRQERFDAQVRGRILEEYRGAGPESLEVEIGPDEYEAMVKRLFDEVHPPGSELGTPLPPPPPPVVPPARGDEGVFDRIVDTITQKSRREERAAREENERREAAYAAAVAAIAIAGLPVEEMRARLLARVEVSPDDLRALAAARAAAVRNHLITVGEVSPDRLFLSQAQDATKEHQAPRVFLSLQ